MIEITIDTDKLIADAVALGGNFATTMHRIRTAILDDAEQKLDEAEIAATVRKAIAERAKANARARVARFYATHDMNEYLASIYGNDDEFKRAVLSKSCIKCKKKG